MTSRVRRQFLEEYGRVRREEGRGSDDPNYYRALPYQDLTGRNSWMWQIRARTYSYFERSILPELERVAAKNTGRLELNILDLGAGNAWMSYRLALRRHRPVALDIFTDTTDGLRCARHYPTRFPVVEAEFDHLPFRDASFDLAIYNSSIHYSTDYGRTLREVRRCLRPGAPFVILDSPIYKRHEHGLLMREERHITFQRRYGFRSDAIASIEFFDEPELEWLAQELRIEWRREQPWYGWRWRLRPLVARLRGKRPPSRFCILIGRFRDR